MLFSVHIYIIDVFVQYSGDQDDKQWLYEKHHMPATGGRTYLLIVDDIKELADTDEYRYLLYFDIQYDII